MVLIEIKIYFYGHTTSNTLAPLKNPPKSRQDPIKELKLVNS